MTDPIDQRKIPPMPNQRGVEEDRILEYWRYDFASSALRGVSATGRYTREKAVEEAGVMADMMIDWLLENPR